MYRIKQYINTTYYKNIPTPDIKEIKERYSTLQDKEWAHLFGAVHHPWRQEQTLGDRHRSNVW